MTTTRLPPAVQRPSSVTGYPSDQRPNRNVATPNSPSAPPPGRTTNGNTEIYTYITTPGPTPAKDTQILYNGDREWAYVTITMQTAGPVAIGTKQSLYPVLSGKGVLLIINEPTRFTIHKGNRLYVASTAASVLSVTVEPIPWIEQIAGGVEQLAALFAQLAQKAA